jgi:hypothetical protein
MQRNPDDRFCALRRWIDPRRKHFRSRFVLPASSDVAWLMPRDETDAALVDRMASMTSRLSDWGYSVSTGPLVWNGKKARLHNEPRRGSVPNVWAESVAAGGVLSLKNDQRKTPKSAAPIAIVAALLASETADRVIRCINASVALPASEIASIPLPPPETIITAMTADDPETAVRRRYGIGE